MVVLISKNVCCQLIYTPIIILSYLVCLLQIYAEVFNDKQPMFLLFRPAALLWRGEIKGLCCISLGL